MKLGDIVRIGFKPSSPTWKYGGLTGKITSSGTKAGYDWTVSLHNGEVCYFHSWEMAVISEGVRYDPVS